MEFIKSIGIVGGFTALSRLFGFIRDMMLASFLGVSVVADAFFVAFKLPNLFRRLFAEGAFNAAFVPTFAGILESQGKRQATHMAEQVFSILFFVLLSLVLLVEFNLEGLMKILAPGFLKTPHRMALVLEFAPITFPYILFISLCALLSGILNSLNRFGAAAATPIFLNISMILALFLFSEKCKTPGHALVWGVVVAGFLQFIWLYGVTFRAGIQLRLKRPQLTPAVRQLLRLMGPGALGAGVLQINLFVDMLIASLLPTGAVSYLFYADRLNQLPLSLTGIAISTVLLPVMTRQLKAGHFHKALKSQNRAIEFGLFLVMPASVALILLAHPLVHVLFERGAFGSFQVQQTAYTLMAFVGGLPAYVLVKVLSTSLFARQNTKTPLIIGIFSVGINFLLNLMLMVPFKHVGIAMATALSAWINVGLLYVFLRKKNYLILDKHLKLFFYKIFAACSFMGVFLIFLEHQLSTWLYGQGLKMILGLLILVAGGIIVFLISSLVVKIVKIEELKTAFTK